MGGAKKNPAAVVLGQLGGTRGKGKVSKEVRRAAASILGRQGGLKGGKARAAALSAEERSAISSKAGKARMKTLTAKRRREIARLAIKTRWDRAKAAG